MKQTYQIIYGQYINIAKHLCSPVLSIIFKNMSQNDSGSDKPFGPRDAINATGGASRLEVLKYPIIGYLIMHIQPQDLNDAMQTLIGRNK